MAKHLETGRTGEDLAVQYLENKGYKIFDRNYIFHKSEIDIVAYIPEELHIVEVKTRSNTRFSQPEEAVSKEKQLLLAKATNFYLRERQLVSVPVVFDVIAISLDDINNPKIIHFEDAFRPKQSHY